MPNLWPRRAFLAFLAFVALLTAATLGLPHRASAGEALVAVAANFSEAARAIATAYDAESGDHITITVGSTGALKSQIMEGAPFDVMLSADSRAPDALEGEGLVVPGSRFTYAVGRLALWLPGAAAIADPATALGDPGLRHIAIANPALAPYGAAAREVLEASGLWQRLQPKIVMGQNIGQTFAMVKSGAAGAGFVAASALRGARAPKGGAVWMVPQGLYAPIRQDAALLIHGRDNPAARGFLDFLKGAAARAIAARYGYGAA